jgi:predicted enzyme related to lactoylglutathione lyase
VLNRIGWVQVFVSDMDRAVDFYENSLGIAVRNRSPEFPEFVELATEGTILALNSVGDEGKQLVGRVTGITLTAPDVEAAHRSLSAKGVRFSRPPVRQPWGGLMTSFFDPDGNEISLLELPPT